MLHWRQQDPVHRLANADQIARAFIVYVMSSIFFPTGHNSVFVDWATYLDDLNDMAAKYWGSAILARVYYALDACAANVQKTVNCFWQLIEVKYLRSEHFNFFQII